LLENPTTYLIFLISDFLLILFQDWAKLAVWEKFAVRLENWILEYCPKIFQGLCMRAKFRGPGGFREFFFPGPVQGTPFMSNTDVTLPVSIFEISPRNFGCENTFSKVQYTLIWGPFLSQPWVQFFFSPDSDSVTQNY
jgi:hypothetical protein